MSLPPVTVHIKRKRTDEPVDLLRIEAHKRLRAGEAPGFVFTRQPSLDSIPTTKATPPEHRRIKQLPHSFSAPSLATSAIASQGLSSLSTGEGNSGLGTSTPLEQGNGTSTPSNVLSTPSSPGGSQISQPRRFHLSRSATPVNSSTAGTRKRKVEPTIFIERRKRPRTPEGQASNSKDGTKNQTPATEGVQKQKKPGLAARISTPVRPPTEFKTSPAPLRNVRLESGAILPWDVTSERLAAEMQAYTLQEIGRKIAQAEAERPKPKPAPEVRHTTPSKFKPKKPALRYAERHPGDASDTAMDIDDDFIEEEDVDEADYIIDTYIRVPAESLETTEAPKNIGLLILESQPDIDQFYREDEESEEEEDDDDEDENAEDHYTADYPEDEVDSDDEFNRNAYNYRNGNASDNEEFDEDDDVEFSDGEGAKYPWSRQPVWMRPQKSILGDEDE